MPTLNFKGKTFVQNHHLAVKYHQLVPQKAASLTDKVSLHDNLIIQGDNLKALKALLPTYAGKVKCIYIDPPYNTGNEGWAYNDNVSSPMLQEWLGKTVDKEDMTRHDKWLCMMMPRLKLLRDLLREDGAIFISIDDNEQHRLRSLCDEIFEAENFLACITWQKKYGPANDAKYFSETHEYVVSYCKNKELWSPNLIDRSNEQLKAFKNFDNDERGAWRASDLSARTYSEKTDYPIKGPQGDVFFPPKSRSWIVSEKRFQELLKDNRIVFGAEGNGRPMQKKFLSEVKDGITPQTWWDRNFAGDNKIAKYELKELFPDNPFDTPKPQLLVKRILQVAADKNSIILDSFSGSGTTAHAVLELNKEDGGNRKFILVEQEDYANTITAERVRRVIKGVKSAKSESLKEGLGGTFSYFTLGDAIEMESLLKGENLPSYKEFARYLFYTATGEEFDEKAIKEKTNFIGESRTYEAYLFYKPDMDWLKGNALTLELCQSLPKAGSKRRLVFAPAKYVDDATLDNFKIDFSQLPFEIYRLQK